MENTNGDLTENPKDAACATAFVGFHVPGNEPSPQQVEDFRQRIMGTNIDQRSFLSTDYFNTFNSAVMVLDVLPDAPELIEELENWRFLSYDDHFKTSGLGFTDLAIEGYRLAPPDTRTAFEKKAEGMRAVVEDGTRMLRRLLATNEIEAFVKFCETMAMFLRRMTEQGSGIVHGVSTSTQAEIDKLF